MTGHICIIFTTTILGVHIFHYYSSNSSTSNHTVLIGVNNFGLRSVQHVRAPVGSRQPQSTNLCLLIHYVFIPGLPFPGCPGFPAVLIPGN